MHVPCQAKWYSAVIIHTRNSRTTLCTGTVTFSLNARDCVYVCKQFSGFAHA